MAFQSTLPARGATHSTRCLPAEGTFQSTLPARGATGLSPGKMEDTIFQSTLPARGATSFPTPGLSDVAFQSTLPARGATATARRGTPQSFHFNPRSPHGERPAARTSAATPDVPISIHAPRTGSDDLLSRRLFLFTISIHAPRTGSDFTQSQMLVFVNDFNPRSPHGERPVVGLPLYPC